MLVILLIHKHIANSHKNVVCLFLTCSSNNRTSKCFGDFQQLSCNGISFKGLYMMLLIANISSLVLPCFSPSPGMQANHPQHLKTFCRLSQYITLNIFLNQINKQTTCQQYPLHCLEGKNFSKKVLLLGTLYLAVNFLIPLCNELFLLHFRCYFLLHHFLPILPQFLPLLLLFPHPLHQHHFLFYFLTFGFWRSLYFLFNFFCSLTSFFFILFPLLLTNCCYWLTNR